MLTAGKLFLPFLLGWNQFCNGSLRLFIFLANMQPLDFWNINSIFHTVQKPFLMRKYEHLQLNWFFPFLLKDLRTPWKKHQMDTIVKMHHLFFENPGIPDCFPNKTGHQNQSGPFERWETSRCFVQSSWRSPSFFYCKCHWNFWYTIVTQVLQN